MKKLFLLLASVAVLAISCEKNGGDSKQDQSIVGEWSGVPSDFQIPEGDKFDDYVRVHYNFKADGTFEQIMPAWEEIN